MSAPVAGGKTSNSKVNIVWAMFQGIAVVTPVTGVPRASARERLPKILLQVFGIFGECLRAPALLSTPLISATSVRLFTKTDLK